MNPSLVTRLRALLGSKDELGLELVMTANGLAAAGVAVLAAFRMQTGFAAACAIAVGAFVLLTACLLSRYTVWIAAVLGSLTLAIAPGAALAVATDHLWDTPWL